MKQLVKFMRYTKTNLKKLEEICLHLGYKVRYEQGYFQSGYCRVEARKILVINKFFDIEGRMNSILDLLPELPVDLTVLDPEILGLYQKALSYRPENSESPSL